MAFFVYKHIMVLLDSCSLYVCVLIDIIKIKFFHDIVKRVHDFLFDHFEDRLVMSLEYIESQSLMDDDLKIKRKENIMNYQM